jgi:hypothetical protein
MMSFQRLPVKERQDPLQGEATSSIGDHVCLIEHEEAISSENVLGVLSQKVGEALWGHDVNVSLFFADCG